MDTALEHMVESEPIGAIAVEAANPADKSYPRWARMLIILGGSVLLWGVIGTCSVLATGPGLARTLPQA